MSSTAFTPRRGAEDDGHRGRARRYSSTPPGMHSPDDQRLNRLPFRRLSDAPVPDDRWPCPSPWCWPTAAAVPTAGPARRAAAGGGRVTALASAGPGRRRARAGQRDRQRGRGLGTIPATAYGLNSAVWDSQMNVPQVQNLLQQAGVQMLRYPGRLLRRHLQLAGQHRTWRLRGAGHRLRLVHGHRAEDRRAADPDRQLRHRDAAGGRGLGRSTPTSPRATASSTGRSATRSTATGTTARDWEADDHASKSPATYAQNVVQYASAMKAVDPSIKIGAVLTLPGNSPNWPDSVVASGDSADWNKTVLADAGGAIDFVIVHWYPSPTSAAADADRARPGGRGTGPVAPGDRPVRRAGRAEHPDRDDRGELRGGHRHPAGRAVRRGHLPDRAGERRVHRGLVGHAQRADRDQHRTGRRHRLRRLGHPVQRHLRRQHLRAAGQHPVPQLLRDRRC